MGVVPKGHFDLLTIQISTYISATFDEQKTNFAYGRIQTK